MAESLPACLLEFAPLLDAATAGELPSLTHPTPGHTITSPALFVRGLAGALVGAEAAIARAREPALMQGVRETSLCLLREMQRQVIGGRVFLLTDTKEAKESE